MYVVTETQHGVCDGCRRKFQSVMTIGEMGGSAFLPDDRNVFINGVTCAYCTCLVVGEAVDLVYWVRTSTFLRYEVRMAMFDTAPTQAVASS